MPSKDLQPRKTPQQERSNITCNAILEAAAHILAQKGYERLTTNHIAKRAGVSIGSLYQYYPNKEGVITALIEKYIAYNHQFLVAAFSALTDTEQDSAINQFFSTILGHCGEEAIMPRSLRNQIPFIEWSSKFRQVTDSYVKLVVEILKAKYPNEDEHHLYFTSFALVHAVDGLINAAIYDHPEWISSGHLKDLLCQMVLNTLSAEFA